MNEKILMGNEIANADLHMVQVIYRVLDHALITRPEVPVCYQPFLPCPFVGFTRHLGSIRVDLNVMYPICSVGASVLTDFHIRCTKDEDIFLNVLGHVKVWYRGELIHDFDDGNDWVHLPISVKKNEMNAVRILCEKRSDCEFGYEFLLSVKRYPNMWANDYLFGARAVIPAGDLAGEEGVAITPILTVEQRLDSRLGEKECTYAWPPSLPTNETFHFEHFSKENAIWYAYSEVKDDTSLHIDSCVERVWVNGELTVPAHDTIHVNKNDRLLLRCVDSESKRSFSIETKHLELPFLRSQRGAGDKVILAGPFYGTQCHGPEYAWDFSTVFINQKGEKVYWRFCDGSLLRIYLDSIFWGQWFYALMVGFYGIRDAAIHLGDEQRQQLFVRNMQTLAKYFPYVEYDMLYGRRILLYNSNNGK